MSDFETSEALEQEKAFGRAALAAFIPFHIWLGMRPRTDGDCDFYHRLRDIVSSLAVYGDPHRGRFSTSDDCAGAMLVTDATMNDERQFFHLNSDGMLAPYPKEF